MLLSTYYGSIEDWVIYYIVGINSHCQNVVLGKKHSPVFRKVGLRIKNLNVKVGLWN